MKRFAPLFVLMTLAGCFSTNLTFQRGMHASVADGWEGKYHHGLVYGLVELSEPVALDKICPSGVASVHQETTFVNGLIGALSESIYDPQSVWVYCADGTATGAVLDSRGQVLALAQLAPPSP
jgi:hypothetical protein